MSRTDEEIISDIQKVVSELNQVLVEAGNQRISVDVSANKSIDIVGNEHTWIHFRAFKLLTLAYVSSTGGF